MNKHTAEIILGDCTNDQQDWFKKLQNSVDLIVTSPPYNLNKNYGENEDGLEYAEYLKFTELWVGNIYACSKAHARFCLNIPIDTALGGVKALYHDIMGIAQQIGWKYYTTIIWHHGNIKTRTAWGSWMSASAPHINLPAEVILVFYKGAQWNKPEQGVSDITADEFVEWTNGLWDFHSESATRAGHPAPYPIELAKRCIKMFSYVGDIVLDPFSGSGTTALYAEQSGRIGYGIEINPEYVALANKRLQKHRDAGEQMAMMAIIEQAPTKIRLENQELFKN